MTTTTVIEPESDEARQERLRRDIKTAKGPVYDTEASHTFCPECNRVMYSIHRYGPMTPAEHNTFFCVCDGKATGIIKKRVVLWDVKDLKNKGK